MTQSASVSMDLARLAAIVREERLKLSLNQKEAAERAGIGVASWRRVEQKQAVHANTLRDIARVINLSLEQLAEKTYSQENTVPTSAAIPASHGGLASVPGARLFAKRAGREGIHSRVIRQIEEDERNEPRGAGGEKNLPSLAVEEGLAQGIQQDLAELGSAWPKPGPPAEESSKLITLSPPLQRLYARLSALPGLVPLNAVAHICAEPNAEAYLEQLREQGLVSVEVVHEQPCVRTLRQEEEETIARRQAEYFCSMALQVTSQHFRPGVPSAEEQLRAFFPSLKRALEWHLIHGDVETTLRFVVALTGKPIEGSTYPEVQQWLERALALPGAGKPTLWRARALSELANLVDFHKAEQLYKECLHIYRSLGAKSDMAHTLRRMAVLKRRQADFNSARKLFEQSLATYEENEDKLGIAATCNSFANLECQEQNYARARELYERAHRYYEEEGDGDRLAGVLENLGYLAFQAQQYERARKYYQQSFGWREKLGLTSNYADSLYNIGDVAMHQGHYSEAEDCFRKALTRYAGIGASAVAYEVLEGYAALKLKGEQAHAAARIFGAAMRLRESLDNPPPPSERLGYALDVQATRAALNRSEFETEWEAGRQMTPSEAITYALNTPPVQQETRT